MPSDQPTKCPTITGTNPIIEGAMIVRPLWGILESNTTSVEVYDPLVAHFDPETPSASRLGRTVELDRQATACPANLGPDDAVPAACFYRVTITGTNQSFYQSGQPLAVNDQLILLGFHLVRMVSGNWEWATFGWQRTPTPASLFPFACGTSTPCPEPSSLWEHYTMNLVIPPNPQDDGATIPAVFNPYLDIHLPNDSNTNCLVCHQLAAEPYRNNLKAGATAGANGAVTEGGLKNLFRQYVTGVRPPLTPTDFLWSLAVYQTQLSTEHAMRRQKAR
jgi:hypothetical protein